MPAAREGISRPISRYTAKRAINALNVTAQSKKK
jgi:hypothetical protein